MTYTLYHIGDRYASHSLFRVIMHQRYGTAPHQPHLHPTAPMSTDRMAHRVQTFIFNFDLLSAHWLAALPFRPLSAPQADEVPRSSSTPLFSVPRHNLAFGWRGFSRLWSRNLEFHSALHQTITITFHMQTHFIQSASPTYTVSVSVLQSERIVNTWFMANV